MSGILTEVIKGLGQTNLFALCFYNEVFVCEYFRAWGRRLSISSILNLNLKKIPFIKAEENFRIHMLNNVSVIPSFIHSIPLLPEYFLLLLHILEVHIWIPAIASYSTCGFHISFVWLAVCTSSVLFIKCSCNEMSQYMIMYWLIPD